MSSRPSPTAVTDPYASRVPVNLLPPPPPRPVDFSLPGSQRRQHAARLPLLTTNIPPGQAGPQLHTPLSTTSLSSPFTQNNPAYTPSPAAGSRGVSPMASRGSAYNTPYNPSEWAPGSRRSSQIESQNRGVVNPEDGLSAPPPPYSPPKPRAVSATLTEGYTTSPAEVDLSPANPTQNHSPASHAGGPSPNGQAHTRSKDSIRSPLSVTVTPSSSSMQFIPPPPARNSALLNRSRPISVSSLSQVMNLSTHASQDNGSRVYSHAADVPLLPPNAKRAASTDAISTNSSGQSREQSTSRSSSRQRSWHPGIPLPGPPPGPPPTASRSQSASATATSDGHRKASPSPTVRHHGHRVPLRPPLLSPMPPTPADWTEDHPPRSVNKPALALQIQTTNLGGKQTTAPQLTDWTADSIAGPSSSGGNLARSAAVRDSSAKGLRERRNLRKSVHERDLADMSALTVNTNPWASAMTSAVSTNRSPTGFSDSQGPLTNNGDSLVTSPMFERPGGSRSGSQSLRTLTDMDPSTFQDSVKSPKSPVARTSLPGKFSITQVPPKALPTPPLSQKAPMSAQSVLPTSSSVAGVGGQDAEEFASSSIRRHQRFLEHERKATSDAERLQLFSDYIIAESVLRRARYAVAFAGDGFDVERVRNDLFSEKLLQIGSQPPNSNDGAELGSSGDPRVRPETMWWKEYQPALSPIASMSNDELSSRGRTSSRWWESQGGSQGEGGNREIRRSKRESKYMGLSTALMQSSIIEADTPTNLEYAGHLQDNQYPEEKTNLESFGILNDDYSIPHDEVLIQQPSPRALDISRLVTLPPPYPRHYPAVNNSHPDLVKYRNIVRGSSEMSEIRARKTRHAVSVDALRSEHERRLAEARQAFKANVQEQITAGIITYAEAAEAEEALKSDERQAEKECLKAEFDTLQDVVINPLHDMLNDHLVQLSVNISELTEKLFVDSQDRNPDRAQQEGDDTPELLEVLTQLKWLFETREQVHKELFDLLTERNNKYRAIVVLPYRQANNLDKVRDTEEFFTRDGLERRNTFFKEALARHEQLFNIIEDNVVHGVELQSSAFWDIAPSLVTLIQDMPAKVENLDMIAIPEQEYLENPSYYKFPQQYLYTLLDHAEKSTYQFIESQINLHCLMHEVKSGLLLARCRNVGADRSGSGKGVGSAGQRTSEYQKTEEANLTYELKQKVNLIEEQWMEALGSQIQGKREQVKMFLEERGGWEDIQQGEE